MIIYRVAQGRAWSSDTMDVLSRMEAAHFQSTNTTSQPTGEASQNSYGFSIRYVHDINHTPALTLDNESFTNNTISTSDVGSKPRNFPYPAS